VDGTSRDAAAPPRDGLSSNGCGWRADKVTDAGTFIPLGRSTRPLRIGADQSGKNGFPGDMDRVRLYARALTPPEVAAHAQRQYEPCTAASGCVAEWTFEELNSGVYLSSGPTSLPARVVGNVQSVAAPEGKGVHFDGTGWLEVAHDPALAFTSTFTWEAWVRRAEPCPPQLNGCVLQRYIDKSPTFTIDAHVGSYRVILDAGAFHGHPWPKANVWTHGVVAVDETAVRYYSDGKLIESCFSDNHGEKAR
jgi:hypothetical protein